MELTDFIWSVLVGIVSTALVGGTLYKRINKNKTEKKISQKGDGNHAAIDSDINICTDKNSDKGE